MKRSISAGGSYSVTLEAAGDKRREVVQASHATSFQLSCMYISVFFAFFMTWRVFATAPTTTTSVMAINNNDREHMLKLPVATGDVDCGNLQDARVVHENSYYDHEVDLSYGEFQYAQLCVAMNTNEREHLVEISVRPVSSSVGSDCDLYVADDKNLPTLRQFKHRSNKRGGGNDAMKIPLYAISAGDNDSGYQSLLVGLYANGGNEVGFKNQCLLSMKVSGISHEDQLLGTNLRRGDHNEENFIRKKNELKELSANIQETLEANTKLARDAIKGLKSAKYRPVNEDFFDAIAQETINEHINEKEKGERVDANGNSVWGKFHGKKEDLRSPQHH